MNEFEASIAMEAARLSGDEAAQALSALTAAAKKQAGREAIDRALGDRAQVVALLDAGEPKVRKNAARLLGALMHAEDAPALCGALQREQTRFPVPSILLALGSVGGDAAKAALDAYVAPRPQDETEEKHCREIADALKKAKQALSADGAPIPVYAPARPREFLLVAPEGMAAQMAAELTERKIPFFRDPHGARVSAASIKPLYAVRTMAEPLLVLGTGLPLDVAAVAAAAQGELTVPYRIELRNYRGDRAAFIHALSSALGGGDDPSRYALELRVTCAERTCDVALVPMYPADARFAYRKRALPASIAPPLAAALARMGLDAVNAAAPHVLDPFCGSGTLLFECEKYRRCAALIGVDHAASAVEAARVNAAAARSRAMFVHKDCLRFAPREPVDLIISNMPFGNRVGTHADNERLYAAFVSHLPALLADGGAALLYTMEMRLLSACLRRERRLVVAAETRTDAGGLSPRVFLIRKRPSFS